MRPCPRAEKRIAADSHSLMRSALKPVNLGSLDRGRAMDRIEQAFVATAITGFLVMMGAIVWMMI